LGTSREALGITWICAKRQARFGVGYKSDVEQGPFIADAGRRAGKEFQETNSLRATKLVILCWLILFLAYEWTSVLVRQPKPNGPRPALAIWSVWKPAENNILPLLHWSPRALKLCKFPAAGAGGCIRKCPSPGTNLSNLKDSSSWWGVVLPGRGEEKCPF